jgi:hypothetical protein
LAGLNLNLKKREEARLHVLFLDLIQSPLAGKANAAGPGFLACARSFPSNKKGFCFYYYCCCI